MIHVCVLSIYQSVYVYQDRDTRGTRWQATQLVAATGHRVRLLPTLNSPQVT